MSEAAKMVADALVLAAERNQLKAENEALRATVARLNRELSAERRASMVLSRERAEERREEEEQEYRRNA